MKTLKDQIVQAQEDYRSGKAKSLDYVLGFADGKAEGRRLERRALKRDAWKEMKLTGTDAVDMGWLQMWLKQRTKPAKRKEGR